VIDCHFCHEHYVFDQSELQRLLAERAGDDDGEQ
jgi:hypothetical protein